jgi:hypothetical protein
MRYRIAENADDYLNCHALMRQTGMPDQDIGFPTLMAIDESGLIGFIATTPRNDMVLAGPMVMRQDKRRPMTALRLATMYERVLGDMGITSFIFYADEKDSVFVRAMERYFPDVKPYLKKGSTLFYSWHIDRQRQEASP